MGTAVALKGEGYSIQEMVKAGVTLRMLKSEDFSARDLKDAGFNVVELEHAGFDAEHLKWAGFAVELGLQPGDQVEILDTAEDHAGESGTIVEVTKGRIPYKVRLTSGKTTWKKPM